MQIPVVWIETLHHPSLYSGTQIAKATAIAQLIGRGKLVIVEPPNRDRA